MSLSPKQIVADINRICDDIVSNNNKAIAYSQHFFHVCPQEYATGVVNRLLVVFPEIGKRFTVVIRDIDDDNRLINFDPVVIGPKISCTVR